MTLPFALRTRIDFSEPPRRTRSWRAPKLAGPILAYWSSMGLLAYGVSSGALPLDEWFWPAPPAPAFEEAPEPAPPPARVTPFPAEPATAPVALEAAPLARERTLVPPPREDDVDVGAPRESVRNEPRRLRLSLSDPVPTAFEAPPPAVARAAPLPRSVSEPRPEPTSHLAWTEPAWGGAASPRGESRRVMQTSPDAMRGRRHIDDGDFLFPGEPAGGSSPAPAARAPVAAVSPSFERERDEAAPAEDRRAKGAVGSCEAAAATANDEVDLTKAGSRAPDVTRDAYASLLDNGRYLAGCRIPNHVRFEICAAVRDGRAVGVTVTTTPRNAGVAACVRAAVSRLSFPVSPRLDVTRTRFEATR